MRILICTLILAMQALETSSQTVLLAEDFNGCALPPSWAVNINGNPDAVWYVGVMQNDDALGQSIDGTCCLIIDDDATGDGTPAYEWELRSPAFDASQHTTVLLNMDLHYRDWNDAAEYLEVFISDGTKEYKIGRFDAFRKSGDLLSDHFEFSADLALLTDAASAQLIIRYNDAGGFAWWAAVDNISVVGQGGGRNVVKEAFNDCVKPSGWSTEVVAGVDDWKFGVITDGAALNGGVNSMNGTCFAFFDDDILGQDTPFSAVRLISPWFSGTDYAKFVVEFDVILRYYKEKIALIVQHADGQEFVVAESGGDIGGPFWDNFLHGALDISPYRAPQMRIIFEYDDGKDWGWWAGLDNIKVTGFGEANDVCDKAIPLITGENCKVADNLTALLDGPTPACTGKASTGLWYSWKSGFNGQAQLELLSQYNAVVEVFSGSCSNLQPLQCYNRDEHGFYGEFMFFPAQQNQDYLIRVSNIESGFGARRGYMCIGIKQANALPPLPVNDLCANASTLTANGPCAAGYNYFAEITRIPTLNERARADVWFKFVAPSVGANEVLDVVSNADFSDIITLYKGNDCTNLTEMASNHQGAKLRLPVLVAGQTYFVQVAGNFATVEGTLCAQLIKKAANAPANDLCASAIQLNLGGACTSGNNEYAAFSGNKPSCAVTVDKDIWFKFTAPASGAVNVSSGADFQHVMAVWSGVCGNLEQVFCSDNPQRCEGYKLIGSLTPGATYFLQIAAQQGTTSNTGDVCIKILDGNAPVDYLPLILQVVDNCIGQNQTQLEISVSGGAMPYVFSGAQNGALVASGESFLTVVKDASGCERSLYSFAKACENAGGCALTSTLTAIQPSCHNSSNGSLEAIVVGGPAPYTYLWSNGATQALVSGLSGAVYSVTITDGNGCSAVATDTLVNPVALTAVPTAINQPGQGQSNGSIFLDVLGGNGAYTFEWMRNGAFFVASEDLTNAPAGNYTLVVTDGNNCSASFNFTLTETVGAGTVDKDVFAEVFPNPAKDKATLSVSFPQAQSFQLSLCDVNGRGLKTWHYDNVSEQNIPLELRDLPSGTYQLKLLLQDGVVSRALVIGR